MNVHLLIDSIVRQTTVLIAQLATTGGIRAPLAHIANQVFLELARELEQQGVSRKVSADMFGMALRAYQRKVRRLSASTTERGRSLWEAVIDFLAEHGVATRAEVEQRFHRDDPALVAGVLHDLVESGLVFSTGSGTAAAFRAATEQELGRIQRFRSGDGFDELVWALVYREGPFAKKDLLGRLGSSRVELDAALDRLTHAGRVRVESTADGGKRYASAEFVVGMNDPVGWEAAMFDHYQSVVRTLTARLRSIDQRSDPSTGGSTYTFDVWSGHPLEDDVRGTLARFRRELSELRRQVEAHNDETSVPPDFDQVVVYVGQTLLPRDAADATEAAEEDHAEQ